MTEKAMLKSFSPSSEFFSEKPCIKCSGEKYEVGHRKYKLCGLSIGELLVLSFEELLEWIEQIRDCV